MSLFPPQVVLYIPSRAGVKGLILMSVEYQDSTYTLTPVEHDNSVYTVNMPATSSTGNYVAKAVMKNCDGILLRKAIKQHLDITVLDTNQITPVPIPVISMSQHTTVFGSHKLKHNFHCSPQATDAPAPAPAPSPAVQTKKKIALRPASVTLSPFVAKQLFELATLRKDQCPIAAEEFAVGNTAVMPCGHLFVQAAIEETFKTEANKCPWCRQEGSPTYV